MYKKTIITSRIKLKTKMKVRNLLLAGLAAVAMTACSNENDETVDNGQVQGTENALIQLGISYPVTTRATEEGLTSEQTFETAKVIVNGDIHTYEYKDFRIGENDNTLYLKDGIPVSAGEASIYVILNLQGEPTTPYASMTASANYVSTLDGLTGYVAKPGAFLMSNEKGEVKTVTVKAGEVATARINVERAAAKLVEQSKTTAFENITPGIYGKKLNITLRQYSFVNLQQDTYVLANTTPIESNFFQAYDAAKATWDYVSKDIVGNVQESTPDANSNITYCLENKDANNTRVVYEAVATWGEETEAATFYVTSENEVYTSFESLAANFGNMLTANGLTAESKAADFRAAGVPIKMYEDGKCYYTADIYTNTASNKTIVRNNVYKLNVSSITKLGEPTPTPTPDPASLNIEVKVLPWTINLVDIIL